MLIFRLKLLPLSNILWDKDEDTTRMRDAINVKSRDNNGPAISIDNTK